MSAVQDVVTPSGARIINTIGKSLDRLLEGVRLAFDFLGAACLLAVTVITMMSIVWRYFLDNSLPWTLDVSGYLFVALTFLAGVSGVSRGLPRMTVLEDNLTGRVRDIFSGIGLGFSLFFVATLFILSVRAFPSSAHLRMVSLPISQGWGHIAIPVGMAGMALMLIREFARRRTGFLGWLSAVVGACVLVTLYLQLHMSGSILYAYLIVAFFVAITFGVPIAFAVGLSGLLMISAGGIPTDVVPDRLFAGSNSVVLLAIPLFMLTGAVMTAGDMGERMVAFVTALVGRVRGGLAIADVGASMLFADISASAVADTAAMGSILIPEMKKRGYPADFSAATQAASGALGLMIPPSSTMIVYAVVAGVSVSDVFEHSFLPGVLVAVTFGVLAYVAARRKGFPSEGRVSTRERLRRTRRALFALLTPVLILGCIFSGATTATEAGAVAAVYALVVSLLIHKSVGLRSIYGIFVHAAATTAQVTLIVSGAFILSFAMAAFSGVQVVGEELTKISSNPVVALILVNLLLVVLHIFLEGLATVLIVVPVILPTLVTLGVDPLAFGVILAQNTALGLLFPPLGLNLYIASNIAGTPVLRVAKAVLPYCAVLALDIFVLILFPQLTSIVPSLLGN